MPNDQVRVRFAPSPTGYLHIGGARTALFNWLLARQCGGRFILRIEDTDQTRNVSDSLEKILADLRWLGLQWDEGPEVGGPHGPYFQSQRLDLYKEFGQKLLDAHHAYYAFDTQAELEAMREQAKRDKRTFRYARPAAFPTMADADRVRAEGRPVVVRFKMPERDITVRDTILGEVTLKREELEDFVILKADGFPTYHFACVVDDECMNITHVLRGAEHLANTPKHIAMQQALGFRTPVYGHLPIICNMSGSKMSKRDKEKALAKGERPPEIAVHDFRVAGYLPEALVNFIALLGWSPGEDREYMSVEELTQLFRVERIGRTNAKFDREKLLAFNTTWAARVSPDRLLAAFKDFLHLNDSSMRPADDAALRRVLEVCAGFRTFADVVTKAGFIFVPDEAVFYDPQAVKKVLEAHEGEGYAVLADLLPMMEKLSDWSASSLEALLTGVTQQRGVGFGRVAQPLRVAVSGTTVSPAITDTLVLLGKERTLARVRRCLTARQSPTPM